MFGLKCESLPVGKGKFGSGRLLFVEAFVCICVWVVVFVIVKRRVCGKAFLFCSGVVMVDGDVDDVHGVIFAMISA